MKKESIWGTIIVIVLSIIFALAILTRLWLLLIGVALILIGIYIYQKKSKLEEPYLITVKIRLIPLVVLFFVFGIIGLFFNASSLGNNQKNNTLGIESTADTLSPYPELGGIWERFSRGYEYYGVPQAEYYAKFTDSEIIYGHINKDGDFIYSHSDKIVSIEELGEGRYRIKIESSKGGQYTYQSDESGELLWYCMTWDEDDLSNHESGSASLGKLH